MRLWPMRAFVRRAAHVLCCPAGELAPVRRLVCGDVLGALESVREASAEALVTLMSGSTSAGGRPLEGVSGFAEPPIPADLWLLGGAAWWTMACVAVWASWQGYEPFFLRAELPLSVYIPPTIMYPWCIACPHASHPLLRTGRAPLDAQSAIPRHAHTPC
jgi:hypothetical protein